MDAAETPGRRGNVRRQAADEPSSRAAEPRGLLVLEAEGCRAVLDPAAGGRLASLVIDGCEILVTRRPRVFHWGSFPIAPWAGRLRLGTLDVEGRRHHFPLNAPPHALHGLVSDRPWQITGVTSLSVSIPQPWPWPCRLTQTFRLEPGCLEVRLDLVVEEPMPAVIGWHPWFRRWVDVASSGGQSGPLELDLQPGRMYGNDVDGLPTGELVPPSGSEADACFVELRSAPRLTWPGWLELTIDSDCPCWVVYDLEPEGLCVEPWTGPPNALNMPAPRIVLPGEPLGATMTWRWRRLAESV